MSLSHRKLSAWYLQLAQQLEAGMQFAEALRGARGFGLPPALVEAMAGKIEAGGNVDDALRVAQGALPLADTLSLSAASDAGRMPRTLRNLAARHEQIGAAKFRLALASAYPLGILHVALVLLPITRMIDWEKGFQWDASRYVLSLACTIGPLWMVIVALVILARRQNPLLLRVARVLPAVGAYMRKQALADLSFALGNFLEAGVPIGEAWAAAGLISTWPQLKIAATAMEETAARGAAPGREIGQWACFPPEFVALYQTGETTGQLEANLLRLSAQIQEAANRSLTFATILYPALLFAGVAGVAIFTIFHVFGGYINMLNKLTE